MQKNGKKVKVNIIYLENLSVGIVLLDLQAQKKSFIMKFNGPGKIGHNNRRYS